MPERVGWKRREIVVKILRWVTTAFRPLSLSELAIAVKVPQDSGQSPEDAANDYVAFAGDLLSIHVETKFGNRNRQTRSVVPVHSSMRDFLCKTSRDDSLGIFRLDAHKRTKISPGKL